MDARSGQITADAHARAAWRYRADIDGLRAVAVTAVVLFHAKLAGFSGGFVGVDIFFVLSGFLIGGIVDREARGGSFSFAAFYLRRARRILPALIAVVLATLALGLLLLSPDELERTAISGFAALVGGSNGWFWHDSNYFSPGAQYAPLLMTWSLGVEEQFYLLLPPLLLLLRRWRAGWTVPAVALLTFGSLVLSAVGTTHYPVEAFYLLPARAWELGAGVLLALAMDRHPIRLPAAMQHGAGLLGAGAIVASVLVFDEAVPFPGSAALLPVLGTVALLAAPEGIVNRRLLASRPFVAIGLLSYSWYLWHWPLMTFVRIASPEAPPTPALLAAGLVALLAAAASLRWIERPFRSARGSLPRYGLALAAMLALTGAVAAARGFPARIGTDGQRVAAVIRDGQGGPCLVSYGVDAPNMTAGCRDTDARPRVALLGDSHANALGVALRARAAARGMGFVQFTKASCPPLLNGTRAMPTQLGHAAECARYNAAAVEAVLRDPAIRTVVVTGFWQVPFAPRAILLGDRYVDLSAPSRSSEAAMVAGLRRTEAALIGAGKRVVLLGDVPGFRFDPARVAFAAFLPARATLGRWIEPRFDARDGRIDRAFVTPTNDQGSRAARAAGRVPGVRFVALADRFCDTQRCRFAQGATPWFVDPQHLSRPGADHAIAGLDIVP